MSRQPRDRSNSLGGLDAFLSSRKVERSPVRKRKDREDIHELTDMDIILEKLLKEVKKEIKEGNEELKNKIEEHNTELRSMITEMKLEILHIKEKVSKWENEKKQIIDQLKERERDIAVEKETRRQLEYRLSQLERKTEKEEKEKRKTNIVITGINSQKGNSPEDISTFVKDKIGVDVTVYETKTIKTNGTDLTIAKLGSLEQKIAIMKAKWKLKNIPGKIYIDDDLTPMERNIQRKLREIGRQERKKNHYVKVGYQKIKIDEKIYKWDFYSDTIKKVEEGIENASKN